MPPIAAVAPAVQSWGAFKRALDLDPAHGLSLQSLVEQPLDGFAEGLEQFRVAGVEFFIGGER